MEHIVVGVDGSKASAHALKVASELAIALKARLLLVHVKRPVLVSPEGYGTLIEDMRDEAERDSHVILEDALKAVLAVGARADIQSPEGPTAETLADIAEAVRARFLVVGSRGRGAVTRVMLGSVADRAVHISKVPVLVVR